MGDLTLGSKLRAAREIKGVDISIAAEKTKILPQMLREMEMDDFHRIAAPIYAKGFIRTYCDYLDIDPQSLIDEYMEKHNQGKDMKSATENKVAKKNKPKIPPLSEMLPQTDLKTLKSNPKLWITTSIGIIIVVILISLIGSCSAKKEKPIISNEDTTDQLISEPLDPYLIKLGTVEAK